MLHRVECLALLLAAGAAACGETSMMSSGAVSVSVVAVSPAPDSANVPRTDTIAMTVGMPMDTASCRTHFLLHVGDSTGVIVGGSMRYADGYQRMLFIPAAMLQARTRYFVEMRDGVMVGDGMGGMSGQGMMDGQHQTMMFDRMPSGAIRMAAGMGWYFTTGS